MVTVVCQVVTEMVMFGKTSFFSKWLSAVAVPIAITVSATPFFSAHTSAAIAMVYLLGVLVNGLYGGRGPAGLAALVSSLSFNFFLSPPQWTFRMESVADTLTFISLLGLGLVVAELSARVAEQASDARTREARAVRLANFTEALVAADAELAVAAVAERFIGEAMGGEVVLVLLSGPDMPPESLAADSVPVTARGRTLAWVQFKLAADGVFGGERAEDRLNDYLRPLSLALERLHFANVANQEALRAHGEELRSTLLSGLSHDLRTPLSTLMAASTTLLSKSITAPSGVLGLVQTIEEQTRHLSKLVTNLLDMTRLTAGMTRIQPEWIPVEEVLGSTRRRVLASLNGQSLVLAVAPEVVLIFVDPLLFEQLLVNLLENAAIHSRSTETIQLSWRSRTDGNPGFVMEVLDRGVGVADTDKLRIFAAFERGVGTRDEKGCGLGLSLCRAIAELHGGSIEVRDRVGGGAVFRVQLPQPREHPPALPVEFLV